MRIVFRVDASRAIGTGHVMRCRTLAQALRHRGAQVQFICRDHPGNLVNILAHDTIPVTVLGMASGRSYEGVDRNAAWSQRMDAKETSEVIGRQRCDWLVVDHYGLGVEWERAMRPYARRILSIDDLADRMHDCDLLLDQNYSSRSEARYARLVPAACTTLLGPRYALLGPEYTCGRTEPIGDKAVHRILVFFGGVDPDNMTRMALEVLASPEFEHVYVDVVVGSANPNRGSIEAQVARRSKSAFYEAQPHLANLIARADIAIGAGGVTTWERLCLGVPSIVISIAENQRPACEALHVDRIISYLGDAVSVTTEKLRAALIAMLEDTRARTQMAVRGYTLVDGFGALRVAEVILPTRTGRLRVRDAETNDVVLYFGWANDEAVRKQSIRTDPIPWASHVKWFSAKLSNPHCLMFVMLADGLPVGQIRFDIEGDTAHIDYSLDPVVRGRKWSVQLVKLGAIALHYRRPVALVAEVKEGNDPSCAAFLRLGFKEQQPSRPGIRVFVSQSSTVADLDIQSEHGNQIIT